MFRSGGALKAGGSRVLYGVGPDHPVVCAVGLDSKGEDDPLEQRDGKKEGIRTAVAGEQWNTKEGVGMSATSYNTK